MHTHLKPCLCIRTGGMVVGARHLANVTQSGLVNILVISFTSNATAMLQCHQTSDEKSLLHYRGRRKATLGLRHSHYTCKQVSKYIQVCSSTMAWGPLHSIL